MKKLYVFCIFIFVLFTIKVNAQEIRYSVNDMTDQITYTFYDSLGKPTLLISEDGDEGFLLMPHFRESLNTTLATSLTFRTISATLILDGLNCVEGGKLIIRFENGERITLDNFARFNCDGSFFFSVKEEYRENLFNEKIDRIMIQDGRSHRSYTHTPENPNFFVELGLAINKAFLKID